MRVHALPNSIHVVETPAGLIQVNSPPEALKFLVAGGLAAPDVILLPPDMPPGKELGSLGFVRQGINYASVEFLLYANFFGQKGKRTRILTVTEAQAQRLKVILNETFNGPADPAAYAHYPWLKRECQAVGFFPPLGRDPQPADLCDVVSLERDPTLPNGVSVRYTGETFEFLLNGAPQASVPTAITGTPAPLSMAPPRPLLRQQLTLQFIGASDGFDPHGITTCFLAYLSPAPNAKPTLFDTAAYLKTRLGNLGLSPAQISEVALSHLHEDHVAGLPELLLTGQSRVRLITSDIVYHGLLRLLSAMLNVPETSVAALFDYFPLNPGHPLMLDGRRFEAVYAVHPIPTLAVRVEGLCYSGDMRYDDVWFDELQQQGILSPERRAELDQFAEGSIVLVQDAGGGAVHTTLTPEVLKSLTAKSQRLVLAHTSKHELPSGAQAEVLNKVEFAGSGHITAIGAELETGDDMGNRMETISACPLFSRLTIAQRAALAQHSQLTRWDDGAYLMRDGDESDGKIYIVHSGLVDIWGRNGLFACIGRGSSVGERGAVLGGKRTGTLRARGPVEMLSVAAADFEPIITSLDLRQALARADWMAQQPTFGNLLWSNLIDFALDFQPRRLQAGDMLFYAGEPGYEIFMLVAGELEVFAVTGETLERMTTPGEFLGGRAALFGQPRNASARALTDTEVWALPAAALQRLQMLYPEILLHLHAVESSRPGGTATFPRL